MTAPEPEPGPFDALPPAGGPLANEPGLSKRVTQLTERFAQRGIARATGPGRLISMRLPGQRHPVAGSFASPYGDPFGTQEFKLDLQRGGLEARALAVTGCTTELEADLVGRTLAFTALDDPLNAPFPNFEEHGDQIKTLKFHEMPVSGCVARNPGFAPRPMQDHELEILGYGLVGVIAAFDAEALDPPEIDSGDQKILEITVRGTRAQLIASESLAVQWKEVPFRPYEMPTPKGAKLDPELRSLPQNRSATWILHASALAMSDMHTQETFQTLMAIDDASGDIVGTEMVEGRDSQAFAEAFDRLARTAKVRPGSVMVTSPRLDGMLGQGLRRVGIRYTPERLLRADDPRVHDVEEFFRGCQNEILEEALGNCGT